MNKTVIIIDDDHKLNGLLKDYLSKCSYICEAFETPREGIARLRKNGIDLVILDVMLPDMDGFEVCREIRKFSSVPVIMLTARGEVTDKIIGLELGADDYLQKPFEPRELLARISSVLRRAEGRVKSTTKIIFKNLVVDTNKRAAYSNDKDLELTSTEYELLYLFVTNNGKVLSREEIMKNTRGISWQSFDRSVDVMVSRLRNKLKSKDGKEDCIKTVHSVGYMFFSEEL